MLSFVSSFCSTHDLNLSFAHILEKKKTTVTEEIGDIRTKIIIEFIRVQEDGKEKSIYNK